MLELVTEFPQLKEVFGFTDSTMAVALGLSVGRIRDLLRGDRPRESTVRMILPKAPEYGFSHCNECPACFPKIPVPRLIEESLSANFGLIHKEAHDVHDLQRGAAHRFYGRDAQNEKPFLDEWLKETAEFVFTWRNILILLVKQGVYTPDQINSIIFAKLQNHLGREKHGSRRQTECRV